MVRQAQKMNGDGDQKEGRRQIGQGQKAMGQSPTSRTPVPIRIARMMTDTLKVENRGKKSIFGS